jgi:hypothetical protein
MSSIPYIREGSSNVRMPKDYGYVYAQVNDWASLEDLVDPKEGDIAYIQNLPTGGGGGLVMVFGGEAIYTGGSWKLRRAQGLTKAALDAYLDSGEYGYEAIVGCIGVVRVTPSADASSKYYYWTGSEWLRTPDGTGYIHPTVASWDSFPSDNVQVGDRVYVSDLDPGLGFAQWDGTDWKLVEGVIDTIADLLAFTGEKELGAKVTVGTGIAADPVYFWSGTGWLRTADQSRYIWPQVNNWSLLTTDRPHAINNDEVPMHTLGTTQSSGTAQLHGGTWKLIEGKWASVTDMNNWNEGDIHSSAIAYVDPTYQYDEDSIAYYRVGSNWVRMKKDVPFTWTLTETQLLEGTDPSGIGAVQEGDYGVFAGSGGPVVVRYKIVTVAAGTTTGTRAMWIPPAAYAGTNLVLDGYALGTESDAQLVAQGLAVTEVPTGTVSSVGGYIRLDAPAGAGNPEARLNHATITGAKKWAVMCQIRGTVTGAAAGLFQPSTETNSQYVLAHNAFAGLTTTVQQLYWTTTWAVASNTFTVRGGGSAWPASTPWLLMAESGAAVSDVIETRVDGAVYSTFRRNSDGAGTGTNFTLTAQAVSGVGVSARLEFKNYFRLVWD